MSGPYRFAQEQARSPLDRRAQSPAPDGQPVSFKTNVNRMKTKKWVEAKKNAYDGDDWGDYDEYDEYGTANAPPPQPAIPPGPRGYGQRFEQPSRSFTDPRQAAGPPQPGRRNSFERGDEHRAFSASMAQPPQQHGQQQYGAPHPPPEQIHPALRQASGAESDISDTPQHRKDFNPTALPPPLHTRVSPAPNITSSPSNTQFPPRKSSIGQAESPTAMSPRGRAPSNPGKALPFVRPAEIYKRYEEEKQRASMESSRPSLDSLEHAASPPPPQKADDAGKSLQPLETVAERKSEYLPDFNMGSQAREKPLPKPDPSQSFLPPVESISSDFGNSFWSSGQSSQPHQSTNYTPLASPPDDHEFRHVVDQAFTRNDDQRSVPPTPVSKSDSGVSRSNTDSTAGISPIMSRVPSGAASALKARNQAGGDSTTPVIVEETNDTGTPDSRPTSANMLGGIPQDPQKPHPTHSRNFSNTSVPRSDLATPTSVESPARSPAIEPQKRLPEPEAAQLSALDSPTSDASTREADIASTMSKSTDKSAPQLGTVSKESQMAFLESHHAQSPAADALPRSRSESPSKGRVQELAGKFGDVSHSRRGSVQSNASRTSLQSWEKSQNNSRPSSPTKTSATAQDNPVERPTAGREVSFRPKLPGQWESYTTGAATPLEQDKELGGGDTDQRVSSPLEEVDITPTTEKRPVSSAEPSITSDPLMALKAAGTAVAEALQSSVGSGSAPEEQRRDFSHGNVVPRPLQVERTASSISTIPPTPPAKDSPVSEDLPPPPPLKERGHVPESRRSSAAHTNAERPSIVPQLSTDPSAEDRESDRLRKEIVASLSPRRSFATTAEEPTRTSLQPTGPPPGRESSIFPSEYDSYFASGSPRPSNDLDHPRPSEGLSELTKPTAEPANASLLTRFSWQGQESKASAPQGPVQTSATPQPSQNKDGEAKLPSSAIEQAGKDHPSQSFEGLSEPHVHPAHRAADSQPKAMETEDALHAPTPLPDSAKPLGSPISPPSGLHVVNSAEHPEAVEMPPRLSAQASPVSNRPLPSEDKSTGEEQKIPETPKVVTQAPFAPSPVAKSPVSDKPLGFRDIVNIKSSSERINTYNQTREYWAHTDHGLSAWVSSAVSANPDLAAQPYAQPPPVQANSTTSRHKATGSISLFGKHHGSQQAGPSGTPSLAPSTPTSAPAHGGPTRTASHPMPFKGKDLLHTAGVLSGKGMTGAKGLFAKGKSRFKSDKAHHSQSEASSREASEEPELSSRTTTPDHHPLRQMSVDRPALADEKRRRRFSSPFHRSSRSRSRPNSIVLPLNTQFDLFGSTPKNTPPRETPPILESRPYSYIVPESWNYVPEESTIDTRAGAAAGSSTLQPPAHLGVLPSPAKSAFSLYAKDGEGDEDAPPVPKIPDDFEETIRGRGKDPVSERLLRSVVRHSTPPGMEMDKLRGTPPPTTQLEGDTGAEAEEIKVARQERRDAGDEVEPTLQQQPSDHVQDAVDGSPLQLNHNLKPSGPKHGNDDEDDEDDLPPQLHHDPIPPKSPTRSSIDELLHDRFDVGQVSPVLSSVTMGADRLNGGGDLEDDDLLQPDNTRSQKPRLSMGDVSPMLPPTDLSLGGPSDRRHSVASGDHTHAQPTRPEYETELIGGDVSPISRQNTMDGHAESDKGTMRSSLPANMGGIAVGVVPSSPQAAPDDPRLVDSPRVAELGRPNAFPFASEQRLSASRIQVLHAVEYVPSRSQSSFETWDQDSIVAPSQSDGSPLDEKAVDFDVPPVPQIPERSLARDVLEAEKAIAPSEAPVVVSIVNSSTHQPNPTESESTLPDAQQSPESETAKTGDHQRSESILSKLSSMVSAHDSSISPISNRGLPRSHRPSATRQQQIPPAKTSHIPVQIEEEIALHPNSSATDNDDFDLYADHDGVVKGVQDESGQPLRVATVDTMQHPQVAAAGAPRQQHYAKPVEEEATRYSEERPMSFVSGPRDSSGRPQDQINRPGSAKTENILPSRFSQMKASNGTPHTVSPLAQQVLMSNVQPNQQLAPSGHIGSVSSLNSNRSHVKTSPHSTVSPPPSSTASPPPQSSPTPNATQRPLVPSPNRQNGHSPRMHDHRLMEDPRLTVEAQMQEMRAGQSPPQDRRLQGQNTPQSVRMQGQPTGQQSSSGEVPWIGPAPRNQYEAQQQTMARHAIDSRLRDNQQQAPEITPPPPPKKEAKPSSRPKISSMLKGLGKAHSNTPSPPAQQGLQPPRSDGGAGRTSSHGGGRRNSSFLPTVGDLPEQVAPKKDTRTSGFTLVPKRSESLGAESHFSHDSTRVQPADSRLNLRSPDVPVPLNSIPPQQPPPGAPGPQKPQGLRASTSGVPDPGKKKRFSALGNLFSRSKEDKKAHKAQKHSTAAPLQPGQQWPPQQYFRPQQPGMQYGPPPAERPFPGMQPVQMQTMSPVSPESIYAQGVHQQFVQPSPPQGYPLHSLFRQPPTNPQGHQQQPHQMQQQPVHQGRPAHVYIEQAPPGQQQQPPPQHMPSHDQRPQLRQEGSAYTDTRHHYQALEAQRQQIPSQQPLAQSFPQPPPSLRADFPPLHQQHQSAQPSSGTAHVPPGGYYKPETKQSDHQQGIPRTSEQQNFHQPQQQQQQKIQQARPQSVQNISAGHPEPNTVSNGLAGHALAPNNEPRYQTPEIPAAYTHARPYVSPNLQDPPPDPQQARHPSPVHYTRQYSEPQVQPLSPQVSALTQAPVNPRSNSETSSVSLISPVSDSASQHNAATASNQKNQKARMSSITEQAQAERPWNLNLPEGATEQEIVRARQRQYMEQTLLAQEQLYAERTGRSPSPRSNTTHTPSPRPSQQQSAYQPPPQNGGGFREVAPRSSPKPYPMPQALHRQSSDPEKGVLSSFNTRPAQPAPVHPSPTSHPTSYPLPISPEAVDVRSRVNPAADAIPPPAPSKLPHSPMFASHPDQRAESPHSQRSTHQDSPKYEEIAPDQPYQPSPQHHQYGYQQPTYDDHPPADEPPPYSGPVAPHEGLEKERQDRHRPPNIVTNADSSSDRGRHLEPRQRQVSIGMLQHPQPASMAASPARSSADMGADSLRRQLLEQEERERQERLQRAQTQRADSQREREERERDRARAKELERSISGGGRVGSLRSAAGSTRATGSGWERRRGSTSRPVFELSAEDDEPVMRATSFPGQEWVPTWSED